MSGVVISKAGGAAAAGGATAAKQDSQTTLLTTIDASTTTLADGVGEVDQPSGATPRGLRLILTRDDALSTLGPAEGDDVQGRADANGALWVQLAGALDSTVDTVGLGLGPGKTKVTEKYLRVTTAQTGADVWSPAAGNKIGVKFLIITWSGANACRLTIWQGANADTTFSDGTDRVLFDENLDANANGGFAFAWPLDEPWETTTDDHELHITTSADKIVSLTIGGYEKD